ncbi:hypothetical protein [Streptomyces sp. NPDC005283]|uniref:hypothetical protein n=1 Tax=Streptomyces sp. NPDC005283 TaxID=3156871 RepID=UPI003452B883
MSVSVFGGMFKGAQPPQGPPGVGRDHLRAALEAADFRDVLVEERRSTIEQPSPSTWWDGIVRGSYGMQRLLRQQPAEVRAAAKTEFVARAAMFGPPGGPLSVPVGALVISARAE